jgi:L-asparaginase II
MAHAYARFEQLPEGDRVARAMRSHPELVGGPDGVDFDLMRSVPGWFAKGGAEGLVCAAGPGALGVALKALDGATRPLGPALALFLGRLGVELPGRSAAPLENTRGEPVGEIVAVGS